MGSDLQTLKTEEHLFPQLWVALAHCLVFPLALGRFWRNASYSPAPPYHTGHFLSKPNQAFSASRVLGHLPVHLAVFQDQLLWMEKPRHLASLYSTHTKSS